MIHFIWSDYNGVNFEEFKTVEGAEPRIAEIKAIVDDPGNDYGTIIHAVINGDEMDIETIEVTSKIRLKNRE